MIAIYIFIICWFILVLLDVFGAVDLSEEVAAASKFWNIKKEDND